MHTLLATNDINNVLLTATFTINTISKFRIIQNHLRQYKSFQMPKYKKQISKSLPLKSNNNMAKELVEQSSIRIEQIINEK